MENTSISASLTLTGNEINTNHVTISLGKEPDYLREKGERIRGSSHMSDHAEWGIHIKEDESIDMDTHLNPIFNFIEQNLEQLQMLSEKFSAEWHIVVCITIRNEVTPGMVLTPRQIELANAIKAHIGFDVYAHQFVDPL